MGSASLGSQRLLAGEEFLDNLASGLGRERSRVAFGEEPNCLDEALSLASQELNGLGVVADRHFDGDAKWSEEFDGSGMGGAILGAKVGGIRFTAGEEARQPFGLDLGSVQIGEGDQPASPVRVIGDLVEGCSLLHAGFASDAVDPNADASPADDQWLR